MQKIIAAILVIILSISASACDKKKGTDKNTGQTTTPTVTQSQVDMTIGEPSINPVDDVEEWVFADSIFNLRDDSSLMITNYEYNRAFWDSLEQKPDGLLHGQGNEPLSSLKYGAYNFDYNGCEVIGMYNILQMIDRPVDLVDLILESEFNALYSESGKLGTNPEKFPLLLDKMGIKYESVSNSDDIKSMLKNGPMIMTFWTGDILRSTVHSVAIELVDEKIAVYNYVNSAENYRLYDEITDYVEDVSRIVVTYQIPYEQ